MAEAEGEAVACEADGARLVGALYRPKAGRAPFPGLVVFAEGSGLGEHARERARRATRWGYAALAADLYGEGRAAEDLADSLRWIRLLSSDPSRLRARAFAAYLSLARHPDVRPDRVSALGFCFGGTAALELARSGAKLAGVVGMHCGLKTTLPAEPGTIAPKVLACIGALDPLVGPDQRAAFEQEMAAARADWQLLVIGRAKHSFSNPGADRLGWDAVAYDPAADTLSWRLAEHFLSEALLPVTGDARDDRADAALHDDTSQG